MAPLQSVFSAAEGDAHKALLVNKYSYSYCKIVAIDRIRAEIVFCLLFLRVFEIHVATLIVSSTRSTESYQSMRWKKLNSTDWRTEIWPCIVCGIVDVKKQWAKRFSFGLCPFFVSVRITWPKLLKFRRKSSNIRWEMFFGWLMRNTSSMDFDS